ncbi:MAG: hypothetical protein AB7H93_00410 [Vicinamibacterales bacterium]
MLDLRRGMARRGPPTVMSQQFRRKPSAAPVASEGSEHAHEPVLGAGDLVMLAIGAVVGARLLFGLALCAVHGFRHSKPRGA